MTKKQHVHSKIVTNAAKLALQSRGVTIEAIAEIQNIILVLLFEFFFSMML